MSDSPRAYWRFGETSGTVAADETGNAPGQYRSGVTLGVLGALFGDTNRAARFDGTNDLVGMSDPASGILDIGTNDATIEAWVKGTEENDRAIISKRVASISQPYWEIVVTDDQSHKGHARVTVYNGSVTRTAYGPLIRVDRNGWHHVVALLDRDSGITVYVDGVAQTTAGTFTGSLANSAELIVGKSGGSPSSPYYKGDLDEVALYGNLLTSTQIQAHFAKGKTG
jgi:Concanavalin A-like lectin/glucanases superfamily